VTERILIVDDNERLCAILCENLQEDGYEVETAFDGRAGVAAISGGAFDLIVLDIRMPNMDGLNALGKMLARNRRTPIVLHTAYGTYKDDFRTWSADAYVKKSSDTTLLKETIRRLLDKAAADGETA
jgi:two-component system, response regulator, stage 0 sporulation protein F